MDAIGISFHQQHYEEILLQKPNIDFFEIHPENYFSEAFNLHSKLKKIRECHRLSFHGIGLSLGSCDSLNYQHLLKLKKLIADYSPEIVSDHCSWSSFEMQYLHDLLPLPYTEESLNLLINKINAVQDYLDRQLLLENITSYLEYKHSTIPEAEFLKELTTRTGCGILLDINNLYVNCVNHGWRAEQYLHLLPAAAIQQIHLAGFTQNSIDSKPFLIDTHNQPVAENVWEIYQQALQVFGNRYTLIEWDRDVPSLENLLLEAYKAKKMMVTNYAA